MARTWRAGEPLTAFQRARAALFGPGAPPVGSGAATPSAGWKRAVIENLAIPDLHVGWVLPAALQTARVVRSTGARAIVSSSPSESSHLAAMIAARITGLPFVAELRDGWTFDALRGVYPAGRDQAERRLEHIVATRAAALVGVTRPIAADLERRFGSGVWIPNGFDDERPTQSDLRQAEALLTPGAFNLVYTGSFRRGRATRSPHLLAAALGRLAARPNGTSVAVTVVGQLDAEERAILAAVDAVRVFGPQPQPVALALQRLADALVLVTTPGEPTVATGKLFEYLGAGRPILALADGNEAAALVHELQAGIAVPPGDAGAAEAALRRIIAGEIPAPDPTAPQIAAFHRRALAGRLAELLDTVAGSG